MILLCSDSIAITQIRNSLQVGFWEHPNFWIELLLALLGIIVGLLAYKEAKKAFREAGKAKDAATAAEEAAIEAGNAVRIRDITFELTEITNSLSSLELKITHKQALDLYIEINRKVNRYLSPYKTDETYSEKIDEIFSCLDTFKQNIDDVRPFKNAEHTPPGNSIYYGIVGGVSTLSGKLAALTGLLDHKNLL